jgi:hypothetical protein
MSDFFLTFLIDNYDVFFVQLSQKKKLSKTVEYDTSEL